MPIPNDYEERVYAGVLGKIIGVYLGRPFEGWTHERITERFGEIKHYVHEKQSCPLIVADDDISGTFTFLRALQDNGYSASLTPEQIGWAWRNYIIEDSTVLWWGGLGISTEHTAFLRLKEGMEPPASGSIATNGKVVAEQIGAQIFIDGWGLVTPGEPEKAADFARRAACVSHDGEAIYGAQVVAAMVAQAFTEPDIYKVIRAAVALVPAESTIAKLTTDLFEWRRQEKDWRSAREKVEELYGYDQYGGGCHIVPNHAIVMLALIYGEGSFFRAITIAANCGWDTDCNCGNVGCVMGVLNGLVGFEAGHHDWRTPVADCMYLPTADGGRAITNALTESYHVINAGRALAGLEPLRPKQGARYHFSLPGSMQGFATEKGARGVVKLENVPAPDGDGRALSMKFHVTLGHPARASVHTFTPSDILGTSGGYGMPACPSLYPGQTVRARLTWPGAAPQVNVGLYVRTYSHDDSFQLLRATPHYAMENNEAWLVWVVPATGGQPIADIGIEIGMPGNETGRTQGASGTFLLHALTWDGPPSMALPQPEANGTAWRRAWVSTHGCQELGSIDPDFPHGLLCNNGPGMRIQGEAGWHGYEARALAAPHMADAFGLAVNVRGLVRHITLWLTKENGKGVARLVEQFDATETILAHAAFPWEFDGAYHLRLATKASGELKATVTDTETGKAAELTATIPADRAHGAMALAVTRGNCRFGAVEVMPV